ncbi:MAG: helix-turn-helix transcriptional regulator [Pseudomonadota bacterium]
MSKRKPFKTLTNDGSPDRRARVHQKTDMLRDKMMLDELRRALSLTQTELADRLSVTQSSVAQMEQRQDISLSHLRKVTKAMGGELRVSVVFPDNEVQLIGLGNHGD